MTLYFQPSIFDDIIGGNMNNPDKCGVLKKQGNSRIKDWKERYCAVKGEVLGGGGVGIYCASWGGGG